MTLYDLINDTTIQGNVQVSTFDNHGNEVVLRKVWNTDDLSWGERLEKWENREVVYMFCGNDGCLHIEIESEGE
jgi:hypothetical protein